MLGSMRCPSRGGDGCGDGRIGNGSTAPLEDKGQEREGEGKDSEENDELGEKGLRRCGGGGGKERSGTVVVVARHGR